MRDFLALLAQADRIVEQAYPGSKFYEADGKPSQATASQESDVDIWRFLFLGPPGQHRTTSIFLTCQAGSFGSPVLHDEPILGDIVIKLPIRMSLGRAIDLKNAAGYSSPFDAVNLRWPLSPGNEEPYYIFREANGGARVFVGVQTESVIGTGQVEDGFLTIEQQTAYQTDPIKIRVVGREDFKVHRIEVVAKMARFGAPFHDGDPVPKETTEARAHHQPNGRITFFGKCTNDDGLWHWGDCAEYADSFSMDIYVGGRFEEDRSGLHRPGYTIRGVKNGALHNLDADEKFFFFNGPPTTTVGPHSKDCPYRLVINTKGQNELVQAISMEPIYKPRSRGAAAAGAVTVGDPLCRLLIDLGADPGKLEQFNTSPEETMRRSGLSLEDIALLLTRDPEKIRCALEARGCGGYALCFLGLLVHDSK